MFGKQLQLFKAHVYNMIHQAVERKNKVINLKENEALFRVDLAENYVAKYSQEVQSVHFGASKKTTFVTHWCLLS